jgi:HK97 family phage major capsid protein
MEIKKLIQQWLTEGKSDAEVSRLILEHKKESGESEGVDAKAIAEMIHSIKKSEEIVSALKTKEDADKKFENDARAKSDEEKRLDELLTRKLKSINIDPMGKKYDGKIDKRWDHGKKEFIPVNEGQFSESYKTMNNLLCAIASGDTGSASKISQEVDSDNGRYGSKATVRSDSNSVGGYAIPTEVEGIINQMTYANSVILPVANTDTIIVEGKIYPVIGPVTMADIADQDSAITESNPTFYNPTIEMKRVGAFTRVSNTILRQKGADLTNAFNLAYASARARYIDARTCIGNITGASQSQDGLVFLGVQETSPVAIGSVSVSTLTGMINNINQEIDWGSTRWVMNQKMYNILGQLESTGGASLFPTYYAGGPFNPLGYEIIRNVKITNVLQVGEDNSTGGTDTVIMLVDFSKFVIGMEGGLRIRTTMDERALYDQTTFIGVERMGWDVLFDNTSASGGICRVQEITGA